MLRAGSLLDLVETKNKSKLSKTDKKYFNRISIEKKKVTTWWYFTVYLNYF